MARLWQSRRHPSMALLGDTAVLDLPKPQHVVLSDLEALRDLAAGD